MCYTVRYVLNSISKNILAHFVSLVQISLQDSLGGPQILQAADGKKVGLALPMFDLVLRRAASVSGTMC